MGFESVVRPAVFPNIRPAPALPSLPGDDPSKGIAAITGSGGSLIDLPWSESFSITRSHKETKRTFAKARIPYSRPDGTLDLNQYVELEIATKIDFNDPLSLKFDKPQAADNLILLGEFTRKAG